MKLYWPRSMICARVGGARGACWVSSGNAELLLGDDGGSTDLGWTLRTSCIELLSDSAGSAVKPNAFADLGGVSTFRSWAPAVDVGFSLTLSSSGGRSPYCKALRSV